MQRSVAISFPLPGPRAGERVLSPALAIGALMRRALDACLAAADRASQRRALAALDERLLKDIGYTPWEARREATKPFWR